MGNPSHEATGSRRAPFPPGRLTPAQQVRCKIDDAGQCVARIEHRLYAGDGGAVPWHDVAAQLTAASVFLAQAAELATIEADVIEAVPGEDFHPDEVIGIAGDPFLPEAAASEGGAA